MRQARIDLRFFGFGANHDNHAFAFQRRYLVRFAELLEFHTETREQLFSLFLEEDGASAEEDVSLHFGALLEEADGVFEFELVVVLVGLRSETDLFDGYLGRVGLLFLLLLFLLVEELLVVEDTTNGRIC